MNTEHGVYVLKNEAYKEGYLKIGKTDRTAEIRKGELYTTGVPLPFDCVAFFPCSDPLRLEKALHSKFASKRVSNSREYFNGVELHEVYQAVQDLMNPVYLFRDEKHHTPEEVTKVQETADEWQTKATTLTEVVEDWKGLASTRFEEIQCLRRHQEQQPVNYADMVTELERLRDELEATGNSHSYTIAKLESHKIYMKETEAEHELEIFEYRESCDWYAEKMKELNKEYIELLDSDLEWHEEITELYKDNRELQESVERLTAKVKHLQGR